MLLTPIITYGSIQYPQDLGRIQNMSPIATHKIEFRYSRSRIIGTLDILNKISAISIN
jgi:hypothetical protein